MYNKTLLNYNNNQQEILISLNSSFEKSLCYRDEGNVSMRNEFRFTTGCRMIS